jgi:hypothetical protein
VASRGSQARIAAASAAELKLRRTADGDTMCESRRFEIVLTAAGTSTVAKHYN